MATVRIDFERELPAFYIKPRFARLATLAVFSTCVIHGVYKFPRSFELAVDCRRNRVILYSIVSILANRYYAAAREGSENPR
jgi:hypothetical protein